MRIPILGFDDMPQQAASINLADDQICYGILSVLSPEFQEAMKAEVHETSNVVSLSDYRSNR